MVVLDTHALLWWSLDPEKLSARANEVCREMEREGGYVSAISVWEIGIKIKRKNLEIGTSLEDYAERLKRLDCLEILPVDTDIWVENMQLPWEHRDPADRTIVATARLRSLPILTKDTLIRDIYPETLW